MTIHNSTQSCPECGTTHDAAMGVTDDPKIEPHEGCALICAHCGTWGILAEAAPGRWRRATIEEAEAVMSDPVFAKTLAWINRRLDRQKARYN